MANLTDLLTARALRFALLPRDEDDAPAELSALAEGQAWALRVVVNRLHRGVADRPSEVGSRAAALAEEALARCLARQATATRVDRRANLWVDEAPLVVAH